MYLGISLQSSVYNYRLLAAYAGQRNRKRALPPKVGSSPLAEAPEPKATEGRKSESEAVFAPALGLEAVTPPPQRRKSMAGRDVL